MRRKTLTLLFLLVAATAQAQLHGAFWANVKLQLPLGKRWELLATEGVRIYDEQPELRRFSSALQGTYFFNKYLRAGISAAYIHFHETDGEWRGRSRYFVYGQGNYTAGRVELALYERFQTNYYTTGRAHRDFWRSRFTAGMPLHGGALRPWAGFEWRYSFNDARTDEWRWTLGNRFRFDGHNAIDVFSHFILNGPAVGWRQNLIGGVDYVHRF